jgi:phosphatidylserine decarboxylase
MTSGWKECCSRMSDRLKLVMIKILPKKTFSRMIGRFTQSRASRPLIRPYAKFFKVDVSQAEKPIHQYMSLSEFFTRRLKEGARTVAEGSRVLVSPVDGRISEFGTITNKTLLQAKGVSYSLLDLLGGDEERAKRYEGGVYLTIYLSPKDYHRIHMPLAGTVTHYTYVPGTLFPVNPFGVRAVAGLFAKNERLITYIDTQAGEIAVVKVGATIVGSVRVVYDETLSTNVKQGKPVKGTVKKGPFLAKGAELGLFQFGSTVILLFEPDKIELNPRVKTGEFLHFGEAIGVVKKAISEADKTKKEVNQRKSHD